MIQESFNSLVATNASILNQAENDVRTSADKEFKKQIYSRLPTQENIKQQLLTEAQNIENPEDIQNVQDTFNKLNNTCNSLLDTVIGKENQLEGIQAKTQQVQANFDKVNDTIEIATPLVNSAKGAITAAKIGLNLLPLTVPVTGTPVPASGGGAIVELKDLIDQSEGKIKQFDTVVKVSKSIVPFILAKVNPIIEILTETLQVLAQIKAQIIIIINYLEQIYLYIISYFTDLFESEGLDDDNKPEEDDLPLPDSNIGSDSNIDPEKPLDINTSIPTLPDNTELDDILNELNPNISRNKIEYLRSQITRDTGYQYKRN